MPDDQGYMYYEWYLPADKECATCGVGFLGMADVDIERCDSCVLTDVWKSISDEPTPSWITELSHPT